MLNTGIKWVDDVVNDEVIINNVKKVMGRGRKNKSEIPKCKGVPNNYKFNNTTVIYYNDKGVPMFGQYLEHGPKFGRIRYKMFKKNEVGFRTGYWTLNCKDVDIVEQDGVLVNPNKYSKDDRGFYVIK